MFTDEAASRAAALADALVRAGAIGNPTVRDAFATVPRHAFLHRFFRQTADRTRYEAVNDADPDWLDMAYTDQVWATQLDGDDRQWERARRTGPIEGVPTCSNTQPTLTAVMLEALDLSGSERVLEIGTGTGYNAALLSQLVSETQVATIDVDAALVVEAVANLRRAGYDPTVVVGDGADGYAKQAPYDRILATCSVGTIPRAWLEQSRPGTVIVTNLYRGIIGSSLVRLTVDKHRVAAGQILRDAGGYMPRRAEQMSDGWDRVQAANRASHGETGPSTLPEAPDPTGDQEWLVLADLLMPDVILLELFRDDSAVQWLTDPVGSWAYHETGTALVQQGGRHRLWDQLEAIYRWWVDAGKPHHSRFGLTIDAGEQVIWLDSPDHPVAPGPP